MSATVDIHDLREVPLFRDLPPSQLSRLSDCMWHKTCAAGTSIIRMDQPDEVVYIIYRGTVKVHIEQADGSDVILAVLGPGEIVGEMSVIESLHRSATVFTMEETTFFWMTGASFQECLHTMPILATNLIRILTQRLRLANTQILALASLDVYGRVAHQIMTFAHQYGETTGNGTIRIPLRLTQSDLADMIGASRMRVNQVITLYKQYNYISVDPQHRITVHNPSALVQRYC